MEKQVKVISLISDDFEDLELWYPILRCREAGVQVDVAGEAIREYTGKYGVHAQANFTFEEIPYEAYDGLLIPGGWAPDKLRRFDRVLEMARYFMAAKKPVGIICHAGWVLCSAEVLSGRQVTSTPGIKDDMRHAGATWVNEPVVTDGNLISARCPQDLPAYMPAYLKALLG